MSELSDNILVLKAKGYTYNQIRDELGCSKGTIAYHLGDGQKKKSSDRQKKLLSTTRGKINKKINRFSSATIPKANENWGELYNSRLPSRLRSDKVGAFQRDGETKLTLREFEWSDVVAKFGDGQTICYLTGEPIDYDAPNTYEFDHIIPRSRGGSNKIDNLGIATREANRAKGDLSIDEFVDLCEKVARYHGRI